MHEDREERSAEDDLREGVLEGLPGREEDCRFRRGNRAETELTTPGNVVSYPSRL